MPVANVNRAAFRQISPFMLFCVMMLTVGNLIFGMDSSAFASFQILPSWLNVFGEPNARGVMTLTTERRSLMNSVQWVGKLAGTAIVEPLVHRFGYRITLYITALTHILGCILEIATHDWKVFSVGRVFQYLSIGLIENCGPTYIVEAVPANLRAFFITFIFLALSVGGLLITAIFQGIAYWDSPNSWYVPIAVSFVPAIMLLVGVPFIVETPRLLVSWGKKDQAVHALNKLRTKGANREQEHIAEVEMLGQALERQRAMLHSTGWLDLFRGTNLRRTTIATMSFIFNQWAGNQFVSAYGPTFYSLYGLGNYAFTYSLVGRLLNLVFSLHIAYLYDRFGRRPLILVAVPVSTVFLILVGAVGGTSSPSASAVQLVVASIILFQVITVMGWSKACWIIGPEIGSVVLRKKTMAFATFVDVIAAFGVTFSSPYMLASISNRVAFVFAGVCVVSTLYTWAFIPETKGRTLEELDELFDQKLWAWQFKNYETKGPEQHVGMEDLDKSEGAMKEDLDDPDYKDKVIANRV